MSVEVGRGYVDIVPDMSGFQDRVGREVEQAASKASRRAEKALNFGAKATAGITLPIVAGFGAATKQASELQQSVGAVESVFGDASESIFAFGDSAAEAAGLARSEVNQMGAVIGAQLKGMGIEAGEAAEETVRLQQRAADMAATFGGPTSDAVEAISALLRGERDTIEKYGVSLKQAEIDARILALGLDTSTVAAEKQATAVASLDLLYEATADSAGAYAREQDTAAGAAQTARAEFQNAAAALGEDLLPIMTDAAQVGSDLIGVFTALPEPVQTGIVTLGGLAAAVGPISLVAGGAIKGIEGIRRAAQALKTARTAAAAANVADGFTAIGASAGAAIPSLKGAAAQIGIIAAGAPIAAAGGKMLGDELRALTGLDVDNAQAMAVALRDMALGADLSGDTAAQIDALGGALQRVTDPSGVDRAKDVAAGILTLGTVDTGSLDEARARLEALDQALVALVREGNPEVAAAQLDTLMAQWEAAGIDVSGVESALDDYHLALSETEQQQRLSTEATEENTEATAANAREYDFAADAMEKAKRAHEQYTDQLKRSTEPVYRLNAALQDVDEAQQAYTQAVAEHGAESDEAEQAALDLSSALAEAESAAIDGDLSFDEFEAKLRDWVRQGALTADQADAIRDRVADLRGEAEDYSGEYTAYMLAETGTAAARINALREELLDITGRVWAVTIDQQGGRVASPTGDPGGGGYTERAGGGPLDRGQLALVGEQGPELWVAGASGQVVSHDRSVQQLAAAIVEAATSRMPAKTVDSSTSSVVNNYYVTSGRRGRDDFADLRHLEQAAR